MECESQTHKKYKRDSYCVKTPKDKTLIAVFMYVTSDQTTQITINCCWFFFLCHLNMHLREEVEDEVGLLQ